MTDASLPEPVARCVAQARAETPAVLAAALAVVDDASFLEGACRLDVALRTRSPRLCDGVALSSLRDVCRARAAMAAGDPSQCPPAPGLRGRDPVCVAVAARDLGLCAAAGATDRVRCEAVAWGDASRCERLDPLLRSGCAREVAAVRGFVPTVSARSRAASVASVGTLGGEDGGAAYGLPWVSRGVFLDELGSLWVVDPAAGWPQPWALGGDAPLVALRVPVAGIRGGERLGGEGAVVLPGRSAARSEDGTLRVEVRVDTAPRGRGDRVRLTAWLRGTAAGAPVTAELSVDSFVRDVVAASTFGR